MLISNNWNEYELLDVGDGEKLERWGNFVLRRPDPQAIWPKNTNKKDWDRFDGSYHRSKSGGGSWEFKTNLPEKWSIEYKDLKFYIQPTGFKHTGLFPEQAVNWDWMIDKIKNANRNIKVLNLFAYTGGASVACSFAGAEVCHVDASKGMVTRAKENLYLSGLGSRKVRFIQDDVFKFVEKEIRRGNKYDAIIMDPPSYGRGPKGEIWKIENELFNLVNLCAKVLSDKPLFFLLNSYTAGFSPIVLENIIRLSLMKNFKGRINSGELGLVSKWEDVVLPCGICSRWEA